MTAHQPLEAPCSLYCGVCRIYQATRDKDLKTLGRLARFYSRRMPELGELEAQDLLCDGCLSQRKSVTCQICAIRECVLERNIAGCHQCSDFPCHHIDQFPVDTGRLVILRAVPFRREEGTAAWIAGELIRYTCPHCQNKLYRGVRLCSFCRNEVSLD
jgi:hypothetical protein